MEGLDGCVFTVPESRSCIWCERLRPTLSSCILPSYLDMRHSALSQSSSAVNDIVCGCRTKQPEKK